MPVYLAAERGGSRAATRIPSVYAMQAEMARELAFGGTDVPIPGGRRNTRRSGSLASRSSEDNDASGEGSGAAGSADRAPRDRAQARGGSASSGSGGDDNSGDGRRARSEQAKSTTWSTKLNQAVSSIRSSRSSGDRASQYASLENLPATDSAGSSGAATGAASSADPAGARGGQRAPETDTAGGVEPLAFSPVVPDEPRGELPAAPAQRRGGTARRRWSSTRAAASVGAAMRRLRDSIRGRRRQVAAAPAAEPEFVPPQPQEAW